MITLADQLAELESKAEAVRRQMAQASCREVGHTWEHMGGRWCGCHRDACCSIPVYACTKCGDCDYGENAAAAEQIAGCEDRKDRK